MAARSNRAVMGTTAVAAAAGCFVTWKLYRQWQLLQTEKEKSLPELAAKIDAKDLEVLTHSDNAALKRSAEQVLVERMMSEDNLQYLLNQCVSENDEEMKKAVVVLSILTKTNEFKPLLIKKKVFQVIVKCMNRISDGFQINKLAEKCCLSYNTERILKYAIVTICDLVTDSEANMSSFFNSSKVLVAFLLEIISSASDNISQDIRRLCILILQQMMQNENMRVNLISYGMIQRITMCFLRTIGDTWMSRNCLQILVMYINFFEDYVTEEFLQEMAQLGIVPILIGCLKFDDSDLVYWSTALIHEFLLKDLHRTIISKIPDIINTFYQILISSESSLQRLVLRIFCFLSINDDNFKTKLSNFKPLLKRMSVCLASGNNDLVYWALLLVHDLAMMGKNVAFQLLKANDELLRSVIALTENNHNGLVDSKLVAETLGFLCSCEKLNKSIIEAGSIKPVLRFLKSDNTDLQFWASSLLLNLAMSSEDARESIIKEGGVGVLLEMAVKESEVPQITAQASKILVMLGFSESMITITLKSGVDSSMKIDGKEYSPMKNGINLVTLNCLDFTISRGRTFDPSNSLDIMRLVALLDKKDKHEVIMLTTQGYFNSRIKAQPITALLSALKTYGLEMEDLENDSAWCLLAQTDQGNSIHPVIAKKGVSNVSASTSISLAEQVNCSVRDDLLKPLLNVLMSIPARSNISKVPELEILSTLARHQKHQIVMLSAVGFLDYLAELIWCFAWLEQEEVLVKPLMIAHCVGALKIVHSLSTNMEFRDKMKQTSIIGAIMSFLLTNCCGAFISEVRHEEDTQRAFRPSSLFSPDDVFFEKGKGIETARNKSCSISSLNEFENSINSFKEKEHRVLPQVCNAEQMKEEKKASTQLNEIETLIAQVTSEKTFGEDQEYTGNSISSELETNFPLENGPPREKLESNSHKEPAYQTTPRNSVTSKLPSTNIKPENEESRPGKEENNELIPFETKEIQPSRTHCASSSDNRKSRSSERSRSPNFMNRGANDIEKEAEEDNNDFDFDEFEEEDLPNLPENEDDNFFESQGRLFFDIPRMASAQRLRSSSGFDPNDWPTTRPGSLSRAIAEATQRSKSPLKDIAADLEDFDEALLNMTNYALMTVYFFLKNMAAVEVKDSIDTCKLLHTLWCVMLSCRAVKKLQFGMIIAAVMSRLITFSEKEGSKNSKNQNPVRLDVESITSSTIISNDLLEIYNGNWTFESAHATHYVGKHTLQGPRSDMQGWYYEVSIFSSGIMQIGWATGKNGCNYNPEKGLGVGDCVTSVGFDGSRCKIWNGPVGEDDPENNYGRRWKIGDTVSCLLSIDGVVSFWLNGQDLGVAMNNLDTNLLWYPAASLSLDQHCRVHFGAESFMYEPPEGYYGLNEATEVESTISFDKSTLSTPSLESATSKYSQDGSSYSSYEVLERSTDRNFSSMEDSVITAFKERQSTRFLQPKSRLNFSPRDLIETNGDTELSEVMYYEVRIPCNSKDCEFEIGFQSTSGKRKLTCHLQGNTLTIPGINPNTDITAALHCQETFGCGLLWPVKKIFITVDGIGTQFSIDLKDLERAWPESLDEILPYVSFGQLQINFGQSPFLCRAMNSVYYRRKFCQLLYNALMINEDSNSDDKKMDK